MFVSATLNDITELTNDLVLLIFLALFTVITIFVGVWFVAANINKPHKDTLGTMKTIGVVWLVVIIGLVIRAAFSLVTVGYLGVNPTQASANTGGLLDLYSDTWSVLHGSNLTTSIAAHPIPAYIALFFGKILDLFGGFPSTPNVIMRLVFRLPYMLCDAAAALVLYKIAKKYANGHVGLGLAAIYTLCPVFFFSSGIWGSSMSILALFILLSLYFLAEKNFFGITVSYALALLTAKEAIYFLPVFAVFYAFYFIKGFKANRKAKSLSFKELFMHKERGLVLRIPLYLIVSLFAMYALHLPALKDIDYNFFAWFKMIYFKPLTDVALFGTNSFSIYNLFGRNNAQISTSLPIWVISIGFMLIATALVYVLYSSRKNRANMVIVSAYVVLTLSIYSMGFWELSLIPVLAVLLLSFVLVKDKRIMHIFGLLAFVVIVNACSVMMTSGYFSGEAISEFYNSTGTAMLSKSTFGTVMNVICSVIAILTHLYFTIVVLDVSISNKRLLLEPKNDSFGASVKSWFSAK